MILKDVNPVGAIHESPLPRTVGERRRMLLAKAVGRFKMNSAKRINLARNAQGISVWQRNYYEHVIRNERGLNRIREYILTNPLRWQYDRENPDLSENDDFDAWLDSQGQLTLHPNRRTS